MLFVLYTTFLQQCKLKKLFSGKSYERENIFTVVLCIYCCCKFMSSVYKINWLFIIVGNFLLSTSVLSYMMHVDVWQNQYNIVK